jgi:hypothetical protein
LLRFVLFHVRLLDFRSIKFDEERSCLFASFAAAAYEFCRPAICLSQFNEGTRIILLAIQAGYGTPRRNLDAY